MRRRKNERREKDEGCKGDHLEKGKNIKGEE
jgi:hypothetical protein